MTFRPLYIVFAALILLSASCTGDFSQSITGKPNAFGKAGNVAILADEEVYESPANDTLEYYFESPFPILPQPEPMVNLQRHTFKQIIDDEARKHLRTYIILANMADTSSDVTKMVKRDLGKEKIESDYSPQGFTLKAGRDKWADNQLLLYIIGKNESALIDGIKACMPSFVKRLFEFDKIQYEANLFTGGHNHPIENKIRETFNIQIPIPKTYQIGIDESNFLWLQDVDKDVTSGLFFFKMPYSDKNQFSEESIIALRDSLTKIHIEGPTDDSYMVVNNRDLPTFHYTRDIQGRYAAELRGIWDMENEFMGGAFSTFLIHLPASQEVVLVDGFVYAPGESKREPLKQLIYLIEEITFP